VEEKQNDKPTAGTVWQEYKDSLLATNRLDENDVILLRWLRPRWDGDFRLLLDYPDGLDLGRVKEILWQNLDIWEVLPYNFDFDFGESYQTEMELPTEIHATDLGNAARLVARYGAKLRFCHPWSRWLIWDGQCWKIDDTAEVVRCAKDTVRMIYAEALETEEESKRKELARHAIRSEARGSIKAMLGLATSEPGIPVLPDQLDTDSWLLNVQNGTLDLRDGLLREQRQEDFITKLCPVSYDPKADCPLWLKFLKEIMPDEATVMFLQRAIGYSLTGDTSERVLFILYGCGDNGKTTFLEVIRSLLGDYALRTPTETLMLKRSSNIPNDVARLRGARFVSASESEQGRKLAEALVKDLTGGDTITARFMRAEWFDFIPRCKIWLATNHKPEIRGTDRAIWNRIRLIPFEVSIAEDRQDKHLDDKLKGELPGILAWAVRGCLAWQRDGLGTPDKVKAATSAYRLEMDTLGAFIEDCCIEEPDRKALAGDLLAAYQDWSGDRKMSPNRLGRALGERGYVRSRKTNDPDKGKVLWHGLGLVSEGFTLGEGGEGSAEKNKSNRESPSLPSLLHSDADGSEGSEGSEAKNGITEKNKIDGESPPESFTFTQATEVGRAPEGVPLANVPNVPNVPGDTQNEEGGDVWDIKDIGDVCTGGSQGVPLANVGKAQVDKTKLQEGLDAGLSQAAAREAARVPKQKKPKFLCLHWGKTHTEYWLRSTGEPVCAKCHPPPGKQKVYEIEVECVPS